MPNKDFQVENFEDGTSVLTITEVFPDDMGEISCVAQNELGVDQTVTELQVHGKLNCCEMSRLDGKDKSRSKRILQSRSIREKELNFRELL